MSCINFRENYVVTRKQGSILETTQCTEILVMCGSHVLRSRTDSSLIMTHGILSYICITCHAFRENYVVTRK